MIQKGYKFRIYPNEKQKDLINKTFGCVRFVWNYWTDIFNNQKEGCYKRPKQFRDEFPWMKEVSFSPIRQRERDFKALTKQFFNPRRKKKIGRPQFKNKKGKQSYRLANNKFYIQGNKIRLEKIGFVTIKIDREISENLKLVNATISRDKVGDFYVSITVEQEVIKKAKTGKQVGLDVGLKSFVTQSDGVMVENPKYFRKSQSKVKKVQQHFSRKVKDSKSFNKARIKVAKVYRKIERQRRRFLHNLSNKIVTEFDVIAVENLNVKGMTKNHSMAKSICDASWAEFFRQLEYKSAWYGKEFIAVASPHTSQTCSVCVYMSKENRKTQEDFTCMRCGHHEHADLNAAKFILIKSASVKAEFDERL